MLNPVPLLLVLSLLSIAPCQATLSITVMRSDAYSGETKVTLVCAGVGNNDPSVSFFWQVDDTARKVNSNPGEKQVTFIFKPELEGSYWCGDSMGNSTSTEILAFPHQDPAVRALQPYSVAVGSNVTLRCVFRLGALRNRYSFAWYKGVEAVYDAVTPLPERYSISDNFSLVIENVQVEDGSKAYHCAVNVTGDSARYQRLGPNFELEVKDSLRIAQGLEDVVKPAGSGESASFHCSAAGSPSIALRWLFKGEGLEQLPGNMQQRFSETSDEWSVESAVTSSTLVVRQLQEGDTGTVECVAVQTGTSGITMATSTGHLVVLGKLQEVTLLKRQEGGPRLTASLPSTLPLPFSLIMRYSHGGTTSDEELMDLKFFDTDTINYIIPRDKLPPAQSDVFSVQIALRVGDKTGELSEQSNAVAIAPLSASSAEGGNAQTLTLGLIIVIVALLIVVVVIAIIVSMFCYINHHRKRSREAEEEEDEDDFKSQGSSYSGSLSRSPSRSLSRTPSHTPSPGPNEIVYEEIPERSFEQRQAGSSVVVVEGEGEREGEGGGREDLVREMSHEDIFQVGTMTRTPRQGRCSEGEKGHSDGEKFSVPVPFTSTH